jgi:flagella basal body P-ring formation protein FlgA
MTYIMTFRQLRWLATLYRHGTGDGACPMPAWKRARRRATYAACLLLLAHQAKAATLRAYGEISSPTVHLADLFEDLGTVPDRVLGPAPAPGDKITVEAPQLAAIARDYAVDWRPDSGSERIILRRAAERLDTASVLKPLRAALTEQGAPAEGDIALPGFDPPLVPAGARTNPTITDASFDPASGRFSATLNVSIPGMDLVTAHLSGQVSVMLEAAVLTHHLHPGSVLKAEDLRASRVRVNLLRGGTPIAVAAALGQALRHDLPPGQPLTSGDVARPVLVARNSTVIMHLDFGEISLSAQGMALEEGGLGETVRVQNPTSKAVVLATVVSPGEVRVVAERAPVEVAVQ